MVKGIRILQVNKLYFPHIGGVEKVVQRLGRSGKGGMRLGLWLYKIGRYIRANDK